MAPGQTQAGLVVGTPQYLSPEQLQGQEADAARRHLLLRRRALRDLHRRACRSTAPTADGDHAQAPAARSRRRRAPHWPEIPPQLEAAILRCLQKDPAARYRSVADLLARPRRRSAARDRPLDGLGGARMIAEANARARRRPRRPTAARRVREAAGDRRQARRHARPRAGAGDGAGEGRAGLPGRDQLDLGARRGARRAVLPRRARPGGGGDPRPAGAAGAGDRRQRRALGRGRGGQRRRRRPALARRRRRVVPHPGASSPCRWWRAAR